MVPRLVEGGCLSCTLDVPGSIPVGSVERLLCSSMTWSCHCIEAGNLYQPTGFYPPS